jgi:hypothetical protein
MTREYTKSMKGAIIDGAPAGSSVEDMARREPGAMLGVPLETIDLVHILVIDKRGGVVIPKDVREKMYGHGGREGVTADSRDSEWNIAHDYSGPSQPTL